jgi:ribonuclease M5
LEAFKKAGVITEYGEMNANSVANAPAPREKITKADLVSVGLSGTDNSFERRKILQKKLGLPENLSANGLLDVLNVIYTKGEFIKFINDEKVFS